MKVGAALIREQKVNRSKNLSLKRLYTAILCIEFESCRDHMTKKPEPLEAVRAFFISEGVKLA